MAFATTSRALAILPNIGYVTNIGADNGAMPDQEDEGTQEGKCVERVGAHGYARFDRQK